MMVEKIKGFTLRVKIPKAKKPWKNKLDNWKELKTYKWDLIILSFTLLGIIMITFLDLIPSYKELNHAKEQLALNENFIKKAKKQLDHLKSQIEPTNKEDKENDTIESIPAKDPYELASKIQDKLKSISGLETSGISVGKIRNWQGYKLVDINLTFNSDIKGVKEVLDSIEDSDYLRIKSIAISEYKRPSGNKLMVRMIIEGLIIGGESQ